MTFAVTEVLALDSAAVALALGSRRPPWRVGLAFIAALALCDAAASGLAVAFPALMPGILSGDGTADWLFAACYAALVLTAALLLRGAPGDRRLLMGIPVLLSIDNLLDPLPAFAGSAFACFAVAGAASLLVASVGYGCGAAMARLGTPRVAAAMSYALVSALLVTQFAFG